MSEGWKRGTLGEDEQYLWIPWARGIETACTLPVEGQLLYHLNRAVRERRLAMTFQAAEGNWWAVSCLRIRVTHGIGKVACARE